MAFYGFEAIILLTFRGLGRVKGRFVKPEDVQLKNRPVDPVVA